MNQIAAMAAETACGRTYPSSPTFSEVAVVTVASGAGADIGAAGADNSEKKEWSDYLLQT